MKKISNVQKVRAVAKKHLGGFTTKDVHKALPNIKPADASVILWKLKREGFLEHDRDAGVYKWTGKPDAAAPTADVSTPVDKKRRYVRKQRVQAAETVDASRQQSQQQLANELIYTQTSLKSMTQRYEDALAIVRYLEDKLFRAIQLDARNGRNS